jgi:hypothetical protein
MKMNGNWMRDILHFIASQPLRTGFAERTLAASGPFTETYGGCDHATGQASFEAETHNQTCRLDGAPGSFAGGQRIRIHDAYCRCPAI